MNSKNNKSPWPYKKNLQNQFGVRSHYEDHLDFGQKNKQRQDSKDLSIDFAKKSDDFDRTTCSIFENVDMVMTSQKLEDRLSQLNRIRTSINCNEFVRLPLLIAALIIGIMASVNQKELLPDIIQTEGRIQSLLEEMPDDQDPSTIGDVILFSQETKSKIYKIQRLKLASFLLSALFTLSTINYYRLSVFKLGQLRDGVYQSQVIWFSLILRSSLAFFHSQASHRYHSTFTLGSISQNESPESLYSNSRIFYIDSVLTSIMVMIRVSYFLPNITLRLYSLLVEQDCEITKSKNKYILTEMNGLKNFDDSAWNFKMKEPSSTPSNQIRRLVLKNLWQNHPWPILLILFFNVWAYSVILYLFLDTSSYELSEFHDIKMQRNDTFYEALFTTSNIWFRQQYRTKSITFLTQDGPQEDENSEFDLVAYCKENLIGGMDGNPRTRDTDPQCIGVNLKEDDQDQESTSGFKLLWYSYGQIDEPWLVKNRTDYISQVLIDKNVTDVDQIKYQTTRIYWENNMQLLIMTLFSIGSLILTTFITNLIISSLVLKGLSPSSLNRVKYLMIDILQDQRGLIRTYSASLIQAYHRIKKYQRLCEFPDHHGKVRPGITNQSLYQSNKSQLKKNIVLFKRNQFLIKQYNHMKKGVDKGAPEYYWGFQPFSKIMPRRQQSLLSQGLYDLQNGVFDKLRLQTLLILNQDINSSKLDSTLKSQTQAISMLQRKLLAMQQTDFFLNKLQNQFLREGQNDGGFAVAPPKLAKSRHSQQQMYLRSIDQIDQFPEILSETSVKKLSERDQGIKQETFQTFDYNEGTARIGRKRVKSSTRGKGSVDSATEKGGKNQSDGYSKSKKGKVDVPNLKKKLRAMRDKLQRDLDGISEEGFQNEDLSGRQVNILISNKKGGVGFEQGTKYKRSKTKKRQGKGSNRSSKRGSSTSKSPSIRRSKTVSQNTSPDRKSGFAMSQTTRGNKEPPQITEGRLQEVPENPKKVSKRATDSRLKDRGKQPMKIKAKNGAVGGGIFMANDNSLI